MISAEEDLEVLEREDRDDPTAWMSRPGDFGPACRQAPPELFISVHDYYPDELGPDPRPKRDSLGRPIQYDEDGERVYPLPEELMFCMRCPVRSECLTYGLTRDERGVWGGMTRYQRRQLNRLRVRKTCPGCASTFVIVEGRNQLCLACGVSWAAVRAS